MDIVRVSNRGTITLPVAIRKKFNLKAGDTVAFIEDEGQLAFVPIVDLESIRKDFPTREEMEKELENSYKIEIELEKKDS